MRLTFMILSVCLFFSGCSQKIYDEPKIPIFQTSDYAPLSVNARKLIIIQNWQMPGEKPFNEHLISPNPSSVITDLSYQPEFGGRPVKRIIQKQVLNELSKQYLARKINRDGLISISAKEGKLTFTNQ